MRVGIIAAAGAQPSREPRLGERDAWLVKSRLELEDLGFVVHVVDPSVDLAEQLDGFLDGLELEDLVFYASCLLAVIDEGDCFLCLDPEEPDVGDALQDVAKTISGKARRSTLLIADLRLDDPDADRNLLTEVLANVQDCVDSPTSGVELIAAVRPLHAHEERMPSRLTAGLLEAIDDKMGQLTARQAYASAVQRTDFGDWPNALGYTAGRRPLHFAPTEGEPLSEEPITEEPITEEPPTARPPEIFERRGEESATPVVVEEAPISEPPMTPVPATRRQGSAGDSALAPESPEAPPSTDPPTRRTEPVPELAEEEDLTPTTPHVPGRDLAGSAVLISQTPRAIPPAPPSERRIAATVTVPKHLKPSAPSTLPKVMIGGRAKPAPEDEPKERAPKRRQLLDTFADGPIAKRLERPAEDEERQLAPVPEPPASAPSPVTAPKERTAPAVAEPPLPASEPEADFDELDDISIEEEVPEIELPPPAPSKKRPSEMTADDHVGAGDLARKAGRDDEALAQFKKALAKLGTTTVPLRAEVYVRIGELTRKQGKTRVAISNFDKALNINPSDPRALGALIELNAEAGNWRAVAAAEEKFFAGDEDDETRLGHLLGSGDLWREGAQDLKKAKKRYDAARALAPKRIEPLERLLTIYEAEGALEHVLDLRRRIAALTEDPRQRAEIYFALGQYCFEVSREEDAYASFELALDSDPTMLKALEVLSNALAEGQEWAELERVYEKMINRFSSREPTDANITVLAELHHRLALLHRDHLEDPHSALASLDHELALRPHQLTARLMASELAVEIEDATTALGHLRFAAVSDPRRTETYHQIFSVAQLGDDAESAFLAASVTLMFEAADDRERLVHQAHRVEGVPALHHFLEPSSWADLKGTDRDVSVDGVMKAIAPAVLRARVKELASDGQLPAFPDTARQDLEGSTISAVRSLGWACQFLAVPAPAVYIDENTPAPMGAVFAREQTTVIGKGALRGRTLGELAFVAGHHVALRLPEHELVAHLDTEELTVCFLAALKIVLGTSPAAGAIATAVDAVAKTYRSQLLPEERDALIDAVDDFEAAGGRVNLRSWIGSVERCAARAGLLVCGDLETAARIIKADDGQRLVGAREILDDLASFTVSESHLRLREALGVTL